MKKLHKKTLEYEKWKTKNSPEKKPWLFPEQNDLPLYDPADSLYNDEDSDEFEEITEDEIDESNVEPMSNGLW